jgi:hypothetical protein
MKADKLKLRIFGDIQRQLAKELARRGVEAKLTLTNDTATLQSAAGSTHANLGDLPKHWRQLTSAGRRQRIEALAEHLAADFLRPAATGQWKTIVPLVLIALTTIVLGVLLIRGAVPSAAPVTEERRKTPERSRQAAKVCEATRSRVMRGATAGPADHEGWTVELALVTAAAGDSSAGANSPGEFFSPLANDRLKVSWNGTPELNSLQGGHVELETRDEGDLNESVFLLRGDYVRSYFDELGRAQWQRFAAALAKQVQAKYGGLYARCSHQSSHHIGSWYAGEDDGAAAAALIYYDAVFSQARFLNAEFLPDRRRIGRPELAALLRLGERTKGTDRTQLAMWTSKDGGLVTTFAERTMLKFPYRDSNRASRSSARIARRLGIAEER